MRTSRPILCTLLLLLAVGVSSAWAATLPAQPAMTPAASAACPAPPAQASGTAEPAGLPTWIPAPHPVVACTQICCTSSTQCTRACGQPASCAGTGSCHHCLIF